MGSNNNETTTKFKVDISEVKAAMQEAKRAVAVANSEFKAVASTMDDWKKSSDGLEAKLKQLDTTLEGQKRQLEILEAEYNNLTDEQKEGSKVADDLIIKMNNQKAAINKTEKEISNYSNELNELKSDANKIGQELGELGDSARESGQEAESGSGGFTVLQGALASLVADGIRKAVDAMKEFATDGSSAYSQFSAATGTATSEMGKWQDAIKQVYNDNFGESLEDVANKMSQVNQIMGDMSPNEMIKVTEAAQTLEDTFGMDFNETLRGTQALMTHFGMTSEEALDYISSGAQNGLNYTDELGDNLSEYSGKFAEAGYSADEYFQLLENGSDGGAYNLDKINDAINEVTTRLGDGTIEDSLDMFSTGTQETFKAWQDGKATQKDVIDSIVKDIQGAKGEQDKMNMAAKAFGTMAEDGGTKFISSLTSVGNTYDDVTGKAKELENVKYDNVGSALSALGRTIKSEIFQPIVDTVVPVITDFLNWCIDHMNIVLPIVVALGTAFTILAGALAIQGIIAGVTKAFALLNGVLALNPFVLIAAAIAGLVAALVVLWNKNEAFRSFIVGAWEGIKTAFSTVVNAVKSGVDSVISFFSSIISFIQANWSSLLLFLINPFAGLFSYFYKNNKKFKEFVDNAVNQIKQLPSKFKTWLTKTASNVGSWAKSLASKGASAAKSLVTSVVNGIKGLPGKIISIGSDVVSGLWKGMGDKVGWLKNQIKSMVGNVKDWLKQFFKIKSPSRLMADEIGAYIPSGIALGIDKNMKPLYNTLKGVGTMAVAGLSSGAKSVGSGTAGVGGVINNYNQTINSPKALSRLEIYRQSKNLLGYAGGAK